jgi:hypothetical protein
MEDENEGPEETKDSEEHDEELLQGERPNYK